MIGLSVEFVQPLFHDDRTLFNQYIEIINKRMHDIANDTYMNVGKMN
jgi:hypothetical protein